MSPIPKPSSVVRNRPISGTILLPAEGRQGQVPPLPSTVKWSNSTRAWWESIWHSPMATQWLDEEPMLVRLAMLQEEYSGVLTMEGVGAKKLTGILVEMRHIEDRFGLNPTARARLRWVIAAPQTELAAVVTMNRPKRKDPRVDS